MSDGLRESTRSLLEACKVGDSIRIKYLLEIGGDPSQLLMYGNYHPTMINALHLACMLGKLSVLKILAEYCDINGFEIRGGQLGLTPLHYACLYGHFDIIQYLCSSKECNLHSRTFAGNTILHMACSCSLLGENTLKIVRYLVEVANCDVNATNTNGYTPLMVLLLQHGRYVIVAKYLIHECTCNLLVQNKEDGNTALHIASSLGDSSLIQDLISNNDGLHSTMMSNKGGKVPLHLACLHNHFKCAKLLAEANLDGLHAVSDANLIPLQYAMQKAPNSELTFMLIMKMEKYLDKNGNSPLHIACLIPSITLAHIAAKLTHNPNITNHDGDTPLHLACRYNRLQIAEILLNLNSDVNIENEKGETALIIVCTSNNLWLVRLFQQKGEKSRNSESPFFIACKVGNVGLVDQMIVAELDFCESNDIGETPIQVAINHGHTKIVKLLITKPSELNGIDEIEWYYKRGINPTQILTISEYLLQLECHEHEEKLILKEIPLQHTHKVQLTPLHYACYYGHVHIVKHLINNLLCDPNMKTFCSRLTPLHITCMAACSENTSLKIAKFLTAEVACNCNSQTLSGDSPLMVLLNSHSDWNKLVHYLVNDCLCALHLRNNCGTTALHIACAKGSIEAARTIIKASIDIDIRDEAGSTPLHIACKENNKDMIKLILSQVQNRVDVVLDILHLFRDKQQVIASVTQVMYTQKDDNGNTPLHIICIKDDTNLAKLVANTTCNPNVQNIQYDTPLHIACKNSCATMSEIILTMKSCDVNIKNANGDTPLHLACRNGDVHIIEKLLMKLPDIRTKNADGHIPISELFYPHCSNMELVRHILCQSDKSKTTNKICDLSMVKYLVEEVIDISEFFKPDMVDMKNVVHVLCQAGDIHTLTFFLQANDKIVISEDKRGWTPLHYACHYGHLDIAAYLIEEQDCSIQVQTVKGETPAHLACTAICSEETALQMLKYLISGCKCDVNIRDNDGTTLLMYLLHHRPTALNIAHQLIVKFQCDLSLKNSVGDTVLHIACTACNAEVVKLIIQAGGSHIISIKNHKKDTPLHSACRFGHEGIVQLLISSQPSCLYEVNEAFHTPLEVADTYNQYSIISTLIYAMYDNPGVSRNTPLHIACHARNIRLAKIIIDMNFNVTAANLFGDTPLHIASRAGNFKLVKLLIESDNCDMDSRNQNGDTPLHEASKIGHLTIVKSILKRSTFPNIKNNAGLSPVHCAIIHKTFEIAHFLITWPGKGKPSRKSLSMEKILTKVKNLIKEGIDPVQFLQIRFDKDQKTFLHAACIIGDLEAVQLLAGISDDCNNNGWTSLHFACHHGYCDIVQYLIEQVESNPYLTTTNDNNTPLQLACYSENKGIISYLITRGVCNPNSILYNGDTLLSSLLKSNKCPLNVLRYLITNNHSDLSIQDVEGNTALHTACREVSQLDTVKLIVDKSDWPSHIKNNEGNTPLHVACEHGNIEIVKTLLSTKKCELYERNKAQCTPLESTDNAEIATILIQEMYIYRDRDGNTPLHIACQNQNFQQIQFIIDKNFDVSVPNDTPLHLLCKKENCQAKCVNVLISSNCNLNAKNKYGDTPLGLACKFGQYKTVDILLEHEDLIALSKKNINGDTPLHLACSTGSVSLVELLLEKCSVSHIKETNRSGYAPLHVAYHTKNPPLAILLLKALVVKEHLLLITEDNLLLVVKQLVKQGVDPMYLVWIPLDEKKKESFLHVACAHRNDIEAVQLLTKEGNSDIKDAKGWTPLHHACFHGNLRIVTHLITEAKCNPNLITSNGTLPLQLVCIGKCTEECALKMVKFLINTAKCDPDATAFNGDTFLIYLLKTNNMKMSILRFLIMDYHCSLLSRSHNNNTALHIISSYMSLDLEPQALEVIKMMATRNDCDASITNDLFDTPLHSACMDGKPLIAEALVSKFGKKCGLHEVNNVGHIPLTIAYNLGHHSIASLLISVMCNTRDKHGNTPLHIACINEDVLLAQYIITDKHCSISAVNNNGDTALHIAVRTGNHNLLKAILRICSITTLHLCNHIDENSLHVACKIGDSLLFQELMRIKLSYRDKNDDSVFHLACKCAHAHIVDIILHEMDINVNSRDRNGETVLHIVCKSGNNKLFTLLLGKGLIFDMNAINQDGNTPLHLACQIGTLEICEEILKTSCNINIKNKNGDTPLFIACKYCHFDILQLLINEPEIEINESNNDGDTLLHILCRSSHCGSAIVRYALEITQINPNVQNTAGETPIQVTSNPHTIYELIRFGANPTDVYASRVHLDTKNPPQPVVKVFIVGNPSVGKSTLTAALKIELSSLAKIFIPTKQISGIEQKTAGIIPHEFDSKKFGSVTLYDFAGHREFYSSHSALLQNSIESSPPIFLVVINLQESYEKLKCNILYWISFLENQISAVHKKPHIIIVGSHADIIKSNKQELQEKEGIVEHIKRLNCLTSVEIQGFVSMDCQYSQSPGMTKLRHYIKESCKDVRVDGSIKFNAHCFLVYLFDRFKDSKAIKLDQVFQSIRNDKESAVENNPLFFLPESLQNLFDLCYELHDRGHILLLKDTHTPLNSWIVIDKESLLSEVTGSIFAPEGLRQYCNLASNTGIVPLTKLSAMFTKYDMDMLLGYLVHLEFCHKISDNVILQLIDKQIQNHTGAEVYYFFPALVQLKAPSNLWLHKPHHIYYCGWILKCSRSEQFFTSRFLEVLILRLAFSFALVTTSDDTDATIPVLQRKCSVWKNGIFWGDNKGVEALFEVVADNKSAVLLMRCTMRQALLPFLKLRSCIICKVLAAVSEFCAKVDVSEFFLDPSEAQQYPITAPASQLYSIREISSMIIKNIGGSICVVSNTGESLPLESVLTFEPYALVGQTIIAKIFGSDDTARKKIPDHEFSELAHLLSSSDRALAFVKLFDETLTTPPSSGQILSILRNWKTTSDGTYLSLHQKLNPFSIFSTRNPGINNVDASF